MTNQEAEEQVLSAIFEKSVALIEELRSDIESRDKTIKELKDALKQSMQLTYNYHLGTELPLDEELCILARLEKIWQS